MTMSLTDRESDSSGTRVAGSTTAAEQFQMDWRWHIWAIEWLCRRRWEFRLKREAGVCAYCTEWPGEEQVMTGRASFDP